MKGNWIWVVRVALWIKCSTFEPTPKTREEEPRTGPSFQPGGNGQKDLTEGHHRGGTKDSVQCKSSVQRGAAGCVPCSQRKVGGQKCEWEGAGGHCEREGEKLSKIKGRRW